MSLILDESEKDTYMLPSCHGLSAARCHIRLSHPRRGLAECESFVPEHCCTRDQQHSDLFETTIVRVTRHDGQQLGALPGLAGGHKSKQ